MTKQDTIYLNVGIDVEEEGLFSGLYAKYNPPVTNTSHLIGLAPLLDLGIRPTLFCAYSVLADAASRDVLKKLENRVEIGAHLHHWNTPPIESDVRETGVGVMRSVPTAAVPLELFADKLHTLFQACAEVRGTPPTSFRMGRWDMRNTHWPLLAEAGVHCDASIRPLHSSQGGPNHFNAPLDPYRVTVNNTHILEVPLTVTPFMRALPLLAKTLPGHIGSVARNSLHKWAAAALLPVYYPLRFMQAITRMYISRGGRVLSITWHSSEMMAGGTPHLPDAASIKRLMKKIILYIEWLQKNWTLRSLTMDELRQELGGSAITPSPTPGADWTYAGAEA